MDHKPAAALELNVHPLGEFLERRFWKAQQDQLSLPRELLKRRPGNPPSGHELKSRPIEGHPHFSIPIRRCSKNARFSSEEESQEKSGLSG
jgi:hypothetical protein